jgi:hypothetical protein
MSESRPSRADLVERHDSRASGTRAMSAQLFSEEGPYAQTRISCGRLRRRSGSRSGVGSEPEDETNHRHLHHQGRSRHRQPSGKGHRSEHQGRRYRPRELHRRHHPPREDGQWRQGSRRRGGQRGAWSWPWRFSDATPPCGRQMARAPGGSAGGITHGSQTEGYLIVSGGGTMFCPLIHQRRIRELSNRVILFSSRNHDRKGST